MSILARKYNLVDKNLTGDLITDNTNIKKHPVGKIIPETIGSDKNLFENNQTQYSPKEDSVNSFHTEYEKDDTAINNPSLNQNFNKDSSLNQGKQEQPILTDIENNQPTLSKIQVAAMANSQNFAPSLLSVPEQEKHGVNHSEGLIQKSNLVASSLDPVSHGSKSDLSLDLVPDRKQYQTPKGVATHTVQTMILDPVQDRMKSINPSQTHRWHPSQTHLGQQLIQLISAKNSN